MEFPVGTEEEDHPVAMDESALRETFRRDGIVVLDGVLAGSALESFREQVSRELTKPCIPPESGTPEGVRLSSPETWPRGSQRRVIEVVPPGVGEHWGALAASPKLRHALDALLGADAWELPSNQPHGGPCAIRHWYCPVVFPESSASSAATSSDKARGATLYDDASSWRRGDVGKDAPPWSKQEDAVLYASRAEDLPWESVAAAVGNGRTPKQCRERYQPPWTAEDDAALLELCSKHEGSWQQITNKMQPARACTKRQVRERAAALARLRGDEKTTTKEKGFRAPPPTRNSDAKPAWVPVNRRRVRGKGWHVDIGPGFDTDAARHVHGDPCQGCVALVLLSDWRAGGGGTAFVAGSHAWVGSFLQSRAPQGVRHQELNAWAIDAVTDAAKRGLLPLKYEVSEPETKTETKTETEKRKRKPRVGVVDQIVGAAGSVALLHPWLVHSGTTNVSTDPRLMANGMVRVRREAFERDGGVAVLRGLEKWAPPFLPGPEPDAEAPSATAAKAADAAVAFGDFSRVADAAEDDAHGVPAKASMTFEDALASARAAAAAAAATRAAASAASPIDSETPSVSVVVPAHDAARWLDECFASVVAQTYPYSRLEVSAYDDASSDDTETIIKAWARVFSELGVAVAVSGSRWGGEGVATNDASNVARDFKKNDAADAAVALAKPGGIGHGKNAAVRQSTGEVLVFLDADDIMTPHRVQTQVACVLRNKDAIVGGSWRRHPAGSTEHYERWANALPDPAGLWLEQFRETTVQMPTWCLMRATYDKVGGFDEIPPDRGEGEDLVFFHKHLDAFDAEETRRALGLGRGEGEGGKRKNVSPSPRLPLRRAVSAPDAPPLLLYRWSPDSGTSRVSRQRLLEIRVAAFRRRVLSTPAWRAFAVWGAGRDAKAFANALDGATRRRIVAMLDVDRNKCGRSYANHRWREEAVDGGQDGGHSIPVAHFEDHAASESARRAREGGAFRATPVVVCVAKRRKGLGEAGDLERNVRTLGLTEGETLWYFM